MRAVIVALPAALTAPPRAVRVVVRVELALLELPTLMLTLRPTASAAVASRVTGLPIAMPATATIRQQP